MAYQRVSLHDSVEVMRRILPPAIAILILLLPGCAGYQIGTPSLYNPRIRTVCVLMAESDSFRRNLGERLTEAVMKEIDTKTTYKLVSDSNADSVLTLKITNATKRVVVENIYDDPREIDLGLQVQVRWIDRHGGVISESESMPLPEEISGITGNATLYPEVGQSVATAQQQAIQRVAEQIVGMMENPW